MMRRTTRSLALLVAALALLVGSTAPASASADSPVRHRQRGYTQVTVAPDTLAALTSLGVTPGVVAPGQLASADPLAVRFPITGYQLRNLRIEHQGGVTLTAGATTVTITNFFIDLSRLRVSGEVAGIGQRRSVQDPVLRPLRPGRVEARAHRGRRGGAQRSIRHRRPDRELRVRVCDTATLCTVDAFVHLTVRTGPASRFRRRGANYAEGSLPARGRRSEGLSESSDGARRRKERSGGLRRPREHGPATQACVAGERDGTACLAGERENVGLRGRGTQSQRC